MSISAKDKKYMEQVAAYFRSTKSHQDPGGSIRDDHVIMTCNKYNIAMAFTGIRLFHH